MNAQLAEIAKTVAPGAHAVLVMDGAGWHNSSALRIPDNITIVTLPPYAPELNPVENIWAYLRANRLAITVFDIYADIVDRRCNAWNAFANDPDRVHQLLLVNTQKRSMFRAVGMSTFTLRSMLFGWQS